MVKRADWVTSNGVLGTVQRVARDGSWADVKWNIGNGHTKRMPTSVLTVQHTIPAGDYMITDMTRMRELEA